MNKEVIAADGKAYKTIKLLGKGKGGYSYLAQSDSGLVVFKKMHYEPCDMYQFEENKLKSELRDYETLSRVGVPMPKLIYSDMDGQFLIKEYIDGDTLSEIVGSRRLADDHVRQIFDMAKLLRNENINIDYFPPNFVENNGRLYYVDYECNPYMDEWNFENWGIYFLANVDGMAEFLRTGSQEKLSRNGKPFKEGFEGIVDRWIALFH
ncbi:hypothetical protein FACS1894217_05860 [Clostridia bacterium]|nr:hypothetical protein FACS1894217_05860 [Clostridia bacterium]